MWLGQNLNHLISGRVWVMWLGQILNHLTWAESESLYLQSESSDLGSRIWIIRLSQNLICVIQTELNHVTQAESDSCDSGRFGHYRNHMTQVEIESSDTLLSSFYDFVRSCFLCKFAKLVSISVKPCLTKSIGTHLILQTYTHHIASQKVW